MRKKRLYKGREKKLFGVCSGIAEYMDLDPTIVRIVWLIISAFYGIGLVAYIACAIAMPEPPDNYIDV